MADPAGSFPHRFADPDLVAVVIAGDRTRIRELAWLGDKALALAVVQMLHADAAGRGLADLSRAAAVLTSNRILARVARQLDLPARMQGQFGVRRLATAVEALIGAVLLDGGAAAVRDCVAVLYEPVIVQLGDDLWRPDAKTVLKERCETGRSAAPDYRIEAAAAGDRYAVVCRLGTQRSRGAGATLREAQTAAAAAMLSRIKTEVRES